MRRRSTSSTPRRSSNSRRTAASRTLKQDLTQFDLCRRPERIASLRLARSCSFRSSADTRLQRDPSGNLHNTDTRRDRASDENGALGAVLAPTVEHNDVLALLPWCGVRADRRLPMRIDSRLRRAVQFRCRRRSTTNFTRPRTRSSNPVPSSRQSVSRYISSFCIEKPAVAATCAGPSGRHGRQRRAVLVNITPTADNISVRPYSSTTVPVRGLATVVVLVPSEAG